MKYNMKYIRKTISLEKLKSRTPNTLVSFKDEQYLFPYDSLFYYNYPNGNYCAFPSDVILPDFFYFSSSTITSYVRSYSFNNISALTNTSVNFYEDYLDDSDESIEQNKDFCKLIKNQDGSISLYGKESEKIRILTYKRLYKWFKFYNFYFDILHSITCDNSEFSYASAEDFYYSANEKKDYETLEYFQEIDKTFLERGGTIERDEDGNSLTHCDLYDWMKEFIFISYDLKKSVYKEGEEIYSLKEYAKNWKNTLLNINNLMYWFSWFYRRYKYFSGITDCNLVDYSKIKDFTCCDCEEYQKLGGDIMYKFLYQERSLLFEKSLKMREYCTKTAEINIPLQITSSNKNIGEFTSFYEEWESGVDLSSKNSGITIHYGGDSFCGTTNNDVITFQDDVFYQTLNGKPSYITNIYKENSFLNEGGNIIDGYEEYLPYYIKNNKEEFSLIDTKNIKTFAYHNSKFVVNPYSGNMCTNYTIITPSGNTHFYCIDNKIYQSVIKRVLLDCDGKIVYDKHNKPFYIYYTNEAKEQFPYIIYNNSKIFGMYNGEEYVFSLKKIQLSKYDWYYISEEIYEFVDYRDEIVKVNNEYIIISFNQGEMKVAYKPIEGYILEDNLIDIAAIISCSGSGTDKKYFCAYDRLYEEENGYNVIYFPTNATKFKTLIASNWDNTYKGYWISEDLILHYIEPYKEYPYGYVKGKVRSRIDELQDFKKSYDRLGKELEGLNSYSRIMPTDKTLLDIYYHVGNTSNLTYITKETDNSEIVYGSTKSTYSTYYWGNIISNISFYFKDDNNDIIYSSYITIPNYYKEFPSDNFVENNIKYITSAITNYLEDKYYVLKDGESMTDLIDVSKGDFVKSGETFYQIDNVYSESGENGTYFSPLNWSVIDNTYDLYNLLDRKIYCKINYNIGAIIKQPYVIENERYRYGMYKLCDKYHKGVEYEEEYLLDITLCKYYSDVNSFINIHSFTLTPTEKIEYYMDNEPDEDSDVFIANTAYFAMENIPNFNIVLSKENIKYTKDLNTSFSDGRQFNFYNGLMASPLMFEEYNIGVTSLRNVNDNIYINRGVNYTFDKHIKLLEVKTLEALENYGNGFFNMI